MLPFLGPSTTRAAIGKIPNTLTWPFHYIQPQYYNVGMIALDVVDKRTQLLAADQLIRDAFDPYIFVRNAYLQSRQRAIEKSLHETNFAPYTTETDHDHAEEPLDDIPDELPPDFDELDINEP